MKKVVFYDVKIALRVLIIYNAFIEEEVFACSNKSGKLNETKNFFKVPPDP